MEETDQALYLRLDCNIESDVHHLGFPVPGTCIWKKRRLVSRHDNTNKSVGSICYELRHFDRRRRSAERSEVGWWWCVLRPAGSTVGRCLPLFLSLLFHAPDGGNNDRRQNVPHSAVDGKSVAVDVGGYQGTDGTMVSDKTWISRILLNSRFCCATVVVLIVIIFGRRKRRKEYYHAPSTCPFLLTRALRTGPVLFW